MSLVDHAKRELKSLGYIPLDQEQEDGPNKWIQENLLELLEVFSKQGHSGSSASYVIDIFSKLSKFKPLSSLKLTKDEWVEVGDGIFQNNRDSRVFKDGENGRAYSIEAYIKKTQNNITWQGRLDLKDGRYLGKCYIKDASNMPTIFLDVIETEVAKDDWEMYLKDESQLDELKKYYDFEIKSDS